MARFVVSIILSLAGAAAAWAQAPQPAPNWRDLPFDLAPRAPRPEAPGRAQPKPAEPEAAPAPTTLESLYERLGKAKDAQEASAIVKQIERRWLRSGSDTADLLMTRAKQAITSRDQDTALELFDFIVQLKPEWAEAYHQRATLLFAMNDYDGALRDINATLIREPRHYAAISGLGLIMQQLENKKSAYAAFKRALAINPYFENLSTIVERLRPEMEGQPL